MTPKQEIEALAAELRQWATSCVDDHEAVTRASISVVADRLDQIAAQMPEIPTNWCDPLLTGPNAVIGKPPYNCKDIERLLNAIRVQQAAADRRTE